MKDDKKLTMKQENFCQAYLETGVFAEAYKIAYAAENMNPNTIGRRAHDLANHPKVKARLAELRQAHQMRHGITVDTLLAELEEARRAALGAGVAQSSAAVSATMSKAKLLGLDKQIIEHTGPDGSPLSVPTVITLVAPGFSPANSENAYETGESSGHFYDSAEDGED